ncbi:MAG TPA: adenylyl-sulfate kinase [Candidatus Methylomirabilis sp.]|nr:adenylyl-sulfate kinase [Candidatus Methylomirabilis sp.]
MSWAIWITGLPGSGKSVLARAAAARLNAEGEPVRVLELDAVRKVLTPRPTYSDLERDQVYRALVCMAVILTEVGVPVIIDATAHRRRWRDLARTAIPRFAEVQLTCPLEVCQERERSRPVGQAPPDIYAHAGQPGATVPGVDVPYEEALDPELTIDTSTTEVAEAGLRITALARALQPRRVDEPPPRSDGWAIWITGRPGSGKTTVAERVAETLTARGIPVRVLDVNRVRRSLLGEDLAAEHHQEIVHRALVYLAKLLTESGVAVILDATAPRRVWREAARHLIPRFAEVQLVCPAEICVERERASRWRLGAEPRQRAAGRGNATLPDIAVDYEESLAPELILHTHAQDLWTMVEQVLFLIHRLRRTESGRLEPS